MPEQSGEKSFDATPHRRQQAREQGQVAYSQDLGSAALLVVGAWCCCTGAAPSSTPRPGSWSSSSAAPAR